MRTVYMIIIFALLFTACSSASQGTPAPVLFSDDFSTKDKQWYTATTATITTDYYNNAFRILITQPNHEAWTFPAGQNFTDVRLEVTATKNAGPDENEFGVICRYLDENQYYYALITSDGYYALVKQTGDGASILGMDNSLVDSSFIKKGDAANKIRLDCIGKELTLYVNGHYVTGWTDASYTSGNIGLVAGAYDTAGTDILFDDLSVYQP